MNTYGQYNVKETPQSEPIPGVAQVLNSAGGYVFELDDWGRLDRFLVLGTEGGTYYVKQRELTIAAAEAVRRCINADGVRTVNRITEISREGRAARNDPAIFALAMCMAYGSVDTRRTAADNLSGVCRTGTHLFHFAQYVNNLGKGWGRVLKRAMASWYSDRDESSLAYQMIKYRQRDGWTHADLLRLAHPAKGSNSYLYDWALRDFPTHKVEGHIVDTESLFNNKFISGYAALQGVTDAKVAAKLIVDYKLPREAVPTPLLKSPEVWEALLAVDMPLEAMVRNLGNMGSVGLLAPLSAAATTIIGRLADGEAIKKARLHPLKVLAAHLIYAQGKGAKGDNSWPVVSQVVDALDSAFYLAFGAVTPTNKNTMLALDVSGSMAGASIMNMEYLTARDASAAMALITANVEPNVIFTCFSEAFSLLDISPKQRLRDAIAKVSGLPFSSTNCALPMIAAMQNKMPIDTFIIYTDSETWVGKIHPVQALKQYRQQSGINAKLIVVGMTSTGFTIADPHDAGSLDVVGFDTATPEVISMFSAG